MSIAEWALRSQRRLTAPLQGLVSPLVYTQATSTASLDERRAGKPVAREWCYMQADLPDSLQRDVDFTLPAFALIASALRTNAGTPTSTAPADEADSAVTDGITREHSGSGSASSNQGAAQRAAISQAPRLWLSPRGAVSPMHYDRSASFLAHVFGTKRMVFVPPDQLAALQPFPHEHMLARRAQRFATGTSSVTNGTQSAANRVDTEGDAAACGERALAGGVTGTEVVLRGGDVVFFGPLWSHLTVSESACCSVTCRFVHG